MCEYAQATAVGCARKLIAQRAKKRATFRKAAKSYRET